MPDNKTTIYVHCEPTSISGECPRCGEHFCVDFEYYEEHAGEEQAERMESSFPCPECGADIGVYDEKWDTV